MSKQDIYDILAEVQRIVTDAQDAGWSDAATQSALGSIKNYMNQIGALVDALDPAPPEPTPTPPQFVSPVPPGAIYGRNKWLPGSLGCDLFLKRGSPICAPADCVIEEIIGGQGINGGAEMILALPDKSWAWRFRHVQASTNVRVGTRPKQGQQVGVVMDTSLDLLGAIPAWAVAEAGQQYPDRYQHCDLSVDKGGDQFAPTGGGGGNVDADQWMLSLGYQGVLVSRTPGPTDAGRSLAESIAMMGRPE